jgi:hypothetical protein
MSSLARPAEPVHVGMDTSKNTIIAAVLHPGEQVPVTERIRNDEPPGRRLLARGKTPPEAVTATARELAGFTWAEMTAPA